jgi:hypothetical protein
MSPDVQPPVIERYGYTWLQPPDGLYYGPPYPGDEDTLRFLDAEGVLGHSSVRRGDYRYILRHPEAVDDRSDRFTWAEGDLVQEPDPEEDEA